MRQASCGIGTIYSLTLFREMGKIFSSVFQKKSSKEEKEKREESIKVQEVANGIMNIEEQGKKVFKCSYIIILRGKSITSKGV